MLNMSNKGAIFGAILGLIGGGAVLGVTILAEAASGGFPAISLALSLIFIVIFGAVFWFFFWPMLRSQAILKSGQPAPATILRVWDTGVTINNDPQVGLLLEVRPPDQEPFQAEVKMVISRLQAALVQPGMAAQVKYDPNHPSRVAIESLGGGPAGVIPPDGLSTGAITVDGQTYTSVDEMPPHVRQAYERVMTVFQDTDGDGTPDILQGGAPVADSRSPAASANRQQRLRELKGLWDAGLITAENYEAKKAEILTEI